MAEDRLSQHINRQLREVRARTFSPEDSAGINAAIREAAGYGPPPAPVAQQDAQAPSSDPRTSARRLLTEATAHIRDSEPIGGLGSDREWDEWVWSRPVVTLLDQQGRLPGERGYDPSTTGIALEQTWDVDQAIASRRTRWTNTWR